jgi:AmmeMemoRadiSam system protein B/AmmeMemoRadiSam system protein A
VSSGRFCRILSATLTCAGLLVSPIACAAPDAGANEERVRPPAVAGQFYPGDPVKLEAAVKAFLSAAEPPAGPRPVALVAPHAGYIYSGQIAADAYRQAMGHEYDLVVILGTNHTSRMLTGISVYDGKGYRTPLGLAEIDREVVARLIAADDAFGFSPSAHEREHSVEVQVPFVQVLFPGVKIVTAIVGRPDVDLCTRFGKVLAETLQDRHPLIVASSDLSHYPAYEDAVTTDLATLEAISWLQPGKLEAAIRKRMNSGVRNLSTCACGEAPVLAAIEAARRLGLDHARIVSYANSGDTALADLSRVVGYGAVVFTAGDSEAGTESVDRTPLWRPRASDHEGALSEEEGRQLLDFARTSIRRYLDTGTAPLARGFPPMLWRRQGVFVTLKQRGRLRGCIGHREADRPLCQVVGSMALQAAFNDRRFTPLAPEELDRTEIEISLLSPLTRIGDPEKIVIGRDGVLLSKQGRGAIYLPEVAVEQGWSREQMLRQLCRKGGLPADAWREGAELYTFQTVVLHESRP